MRRILVVDDDPEIRGIIQVVLETEFQVLGVADAKQALAAFKKSPPDLTLLDMELPDAHGHSLLRKLLKAYPGTLIVMVTGNQSLARARETITLGAREYIAKPFAPDHLRSVVRGLLKTG